MADPRQAAGLGNMLSQYGTPPEVIQRWGEDPARPGGIFDQYQRDVNAPYGSNIGTARNPTYLSGDLNAGVRAGRTQDANIAAQRMQQMLESLPADQRRYYETIRQTGRTPAQQKQMFESQFGQGTFPGTGQ